MATCDLGGAKKRDKPLVHRRNSDIQAEAAWAISPPIGMMLMAVTQNPAVET